MPWKSASERWARQTLRWVGATTRLRPSCRRPWPARERWSRCPPAHGRAPARREGRPEVRGRRTKRCRSLAHSAGRRQCTRQRVCSRSVHSTRPGRVRSGWAATPAQTRTLLRQRGQEQASRLEAQLACAAREARAPQQRRRARFSAALQNSGESSSTDSAHTWRRVRRSGRGGVAAHPLLAAVPQDVLLPQRRLPLAGLAHRLQPARRSAPRCGTENGAREEWWKREPVWRAGIR